MRQNFGFQNKEYKKVSELSQKVMGHNEVESNYGSTVQTLKSLCAEINPRSQLSRILKLFSTKNSKEKLTQNLNELSRTRISADQINIIKDSQNRNNYDFLDGFNYSSDLFWQLLNKLYLNEKLCKLILNYSPSSPNDSYYQALFKGIKDDYDILISLVKNRFIKLPITSMKLNIKEHPYTLQDHVHTTSYENLIFENIIKEQYSKYKLKSLPSIIFSQFKPKKISSNIHMYVNVANKNQKATNESCNKRAMQLQKTLYLNREMLLQLTSLLNKLHENYERLEKQELHDHFQSSTSTIKLDQLNEEIKLSLISEHLYHAALASDLTKANKSRLNTIKRSKHSRKEYNIDSVYKTFDPTKFKIQFDDLITLTNAKKEETNSVSNDQEYLESEKPKIFYNWSLQKHDLIKENDRLFGKKKKFIQLRTMTLIREKRKIEQ